MPSNASLRACRRTRLIAALTGPLDESEAPYKNDEDMVEVKANSSDESTVKVFEFNKPVSKEDQDKYNIFIAVEGGAPLTLPVADEDYIGEGVRCTTLTEDLAKAGSVLNYAASPIFDENGLFVCEDNNNERNYTWSLPLSKRFYLSYELEESTALPSPAATDENGNYRYDAAATAAIKRQLMSGHGVHIEFNADASRPGQKQRQDGFINTKTWAHYTYDKTGEGTKVDINHDVCIVGWDDTYAVENFNQGTYTNPDTGAEVNRFPPAPGAWIVKNSWGATGQGFPNEAAWGVDGSGYFYLSYYDMSLDRINVYDYYTEHLYGNREAIYVNQHDFMPCYDVSGVPVDTETRFANVFTAEDDQLVRTLSVETSVPNTHAKLELYRLGGQATGDAAGGELDAQADGAAAVSDPTAGELVDTVEADYAWAGYHRLQLDRSHLMAKGERFAVVATLSVSNAEGKTSYAVPMHSYFNESALQREGYENLSVTGHGVINKGESFLYEDGAWLDLVDAIGEIRKRMEDTGDIRDYDNFPLKAFADENTPYTLTKEVVDEKELYYPGDVVAYRVSVKNEGKAALEDVVITDSLVELGEKGAIASAPAGETATVEYTYTVTDADAQRGSFTNTATATLAKVEGIEAKVDVTLKAAARTAPQPEQPANPAPEQPADSRPEQPANPAPEQKAAAATPKKTLPTTGDTTQPAVVATLGGLGICMLGLSRKMRRQ